MILMITVTSEILYANCSKPFGLSFLNRTTTSIEVRWSDGNVSPQSWELELVSRNKTPSGNPTIKDLISRNYIFNNLISSAAYDLYIRTKCSESSFSDWNGPFLFTTVFTNPTPCSINVPVKDNGTEIFNIEVKDQGNLGSTIFISSVELIMEHTWPADMQLSLETPSGKSIILSNHNGTVTDDYGDITDLSCMRSTVFDSDACLNLREDKPPYIGRYRPDESFALLEDDSRSDGIWKLKTLDRAAQDIGIIRFFKINFSQERCVTPDNFLITAIENNAIEVEWNSFALCNAVQISVGYPGLPADSLLKFFVSCQNKKFRIDGLFPNTEYQVFINAICGTGLSTGSCPLIFKTSCESASESESFDLMDRCIGGCAFNCTINGVWNNIDYDGPQDWVVWSGRTDTENTGPDSDISGNGNYLYVENNPEICGLENVVILESECMQIGSNPSGCDMSFYYHLFGKDIGTLRLEINSGADNVWTTLFEASGQKGNQWLQHTLSLTEYNGQLAKLRFVASTGADIFADIALDQIEFYKSEKSEHLVRYYLDQDNDGYGSDTEFLDLCTLNIPDGYAVQSGDCDDLNPDINPGKNEIPCNLIDENCNGNADDNPESNPILYNVEIQHESCNGFQDGSIIMNISGGTAPYSVMWNNGNTGYENKNISGGIYFAEILDFGGCMIRTDFYEVKTNTQINFTVFSMDRPSCSGRDDGNLVIAHSGGTGPYSYNWSNGAITKDLTNIGGGTYNVTITDASGCVFHSREIEIQPRPSVIADIVRTKSPTCFGFSNGEIEIQALNGTPPYQYQWGNGANQRVLTGVKSGPYSCTVTDAAGCLFIFNTHLNEPPALKSELVSLEQVRCFGETNGAIRTITTGGLPPYTYLWNNFLFNESIFDVPAGTYHLQVNDRNGCESILSNIVVSQPTQLLSKVEKITPSVCPLGKNGKIEIAVSGGIPEYQYAWKNTDSDYYIADKLITGVYSVTAFDRNGCKSNLNNIQLPFTNVPVVSELELIEENLCYLDRKAKLKATVLNGTAPYDFNWSTGIQYIKNAITDTLSTLPAGNYLLTVTDALGCFGNSNPVHIAEKTPYNYSVTEIINNVCTDDDDGEISIEISGGNDPISVNWNSGNTGQHINQLSNGIYSGTITDASNCQLKINPVLVTSASNLALTADIHDANPGSPNGKICLNIQGAVGPIVIKWNANVSGQGLCAENLVAGIYHVTITDNLGCEIESSFTVGVSTSNMEYIDVQPFIIFPNPASEILSINGHRKSVDIKIKDLQYKLLKAYNTVALPVVLDISDLPPGYYFISIHSDTRSSVHKFIKI